MKAILLAFFSFALALVSPAQTCREVVRDAPGRVVQTIDRQKSASGSLQATARDASGRIIGSGTSDYSIRLSLQRTPVEMLSKIDSELTAGLRFNPQKRELFSPLTHL